MTLSRPGAAQTPSGARPNRSAKASAARTRRIAHGSTTARSCSATSSGLVSVMNAPMPDSEPARYLSLPGARRSENSCRCSHHSSRARGGRLVPGGDVGHRGVEAVREAAQHVEVDGHEGVPLVVGQRREVGHLPGREQLHLVGPARRGRDERGPVLVLRDHPRPGPLGGHDLGEQVAPGGLAVAADRAEHLLHPRRHERVGVDLPVRVGERHPDLLAVVLEDEDLLDAVDAGELRGPLGPDVDDQAGAGGTQLGEVAVVVAGEDDDLAAAEPGAQLGQRRTGGARRHVLLDAGGQRREAVLEGDDLVVGVRDLGGPTGPGRAQRALVGRREEGAGLPVRGDDDPLAQQGVPAELRVGGDRRQVAGVGGVVGRGRRLVVEVQDLPAIGQVTTGPDHRGCASRTGQAAHHCR